MVDTNEQGVLRAENIERIVKGVALQEMKMMQLCSVETSNSWIESYWREGATELSASGPYNVKGIPRLANFPNADVNWSKVSAYIEKYALETTISMEDEMMGAIDQISRCLLRIGRGVAYAIDLQIFSGIWSNSGNTLAISAGKEWNASSVALRDPIQNLLDGKREIDTDNIDIDSGGYLLVNPKDYANLCGNTKVLNSPTYKSADVVTNGKVGQIVALTIVKSPVVTVSCAVILKGKEACTWKSAKGVEVATIENKGIGKTIRAWALGVLQVPMPNAICKITGTDSGA